MRNMGIVIMAAGALVITAGIFQWKWFMNTRRAKFFLNKFGEKGVRIFYIISGSIVMILGLLAVVGIIKE